MFFVLQYVRLFNWPICVKMITPDNYSTWTYSMNLFLIKKKKKKEMYWDYVHILEKTTCLNKIHVSIVKVRKQSHGATKSDVMWISTMAGISLVLPLHWQKPRMWITLAVWFPGNCSRGRTAIFSHWHTLLVCCHPLVCQGFSQGAIKLQRFIGWWTSTQNVSDGREG